jgi:hypothetical protein
VVATTKERVDGSSPPTTGTARKLLTCARKPGVETFAMLLATEACCSMACLAPLMAT